MMERMGEYEQIDLAAKYIQLNRARWTQPPGPLQKTARTAEMIRSHVSVSWRRYDVCLFPIISPTIRLPL
jgi:hypothetical protein